MTYDEQSYFRMWVTDDLKQIIEKTLSDTELRSWINREEHMVLNFYTIPLRRPTKTLLHHFIENTNPLNDQKVLLLLSMKADPNRKTRPDEHSKSFSPLQLAVKNGNAQSVHHLLNYGAKPTQDEEGNTELHLLAALNSEKITEHEFKDIASDLVRHGVNHSGGNLNAETPSDIAKEHDDQTPLHFNRVEALFDSTHDVEPKSRLKTVDINSVLDRAEDSIANRLKLHFIPALKQVFEGPDYTEFQTDELGVLSTTNAIIARVRNIDIMRNKCFIPSASKIFDGMASVGSDSISFMYDFGDGLVVSNELTENRFQCLCRNMKLCKDFKDSKIRKRKFTNINILTRGNVLDMWDSPVFLECNVLYLDPHWGGPNPQDAEHYDQYDDLTVTVKNELEERASEMNMEDVVKQAFDKSPNLKFAVLKFPKNYNRQQMLRLYDLGLCAKAYRIFVNSSSNDTDNSKMTFYHEKMIFIVVQRNERGKMPEPEIPLFIFKGKVIINYTAAFKAQGPPPLFRCTLADYPQYRFN